MNPIALRLESFTSPPPAAQAAITIAEEEAFQNGYEKGFAEGRELSLDALTSALTTLHRDLLTAHKRESELRRDLQTALTPVLQAIVDLLAPRSEQERLCHALTAEIGQIIKHTPGQIITIRCPEDLQPDLADCLERAGILDARIEAADTGQSIVELTAAQGQIIFDPASAIAGLKSIINDIGARD
ncbi:hypothetical protein [Paracoccus sp. J56]|uniref:hypothetical protein n=1 Tax=Paracoccus sp. J56 TaxID=935850 RepID=UPI000A0C4031|nr:hypothetical protein [Paracoccus sp. J56]SMG33144.1 hypothetical protein SAMN02746000_01935 [Paracoccus sp. J56]